MISFNDILDGGTAFQGPLRVVNVTHEGRLVTVFEGDGEDCPGDEPWGNGYASFVYYDKADGCMTVEIEEE